MLMGLGSGDEGEESGTDTTEQISSGIASEVRSELAEAVSESKPGSDRVDRIEKALQDLQETVSAQLRRPNRDHLRTVTDELTAAVRELPLEARALLSILSRGPHLTRKEYRSAVQNPGLKTSIKALRSAGLLVPLEGIEDGEPVPVYYLPPKLGKDIRVALRLAGDVPRDAVTEVFSALAATGYESPRGI